MISRIKWWKELKIGWGGQGTNKVYTINYGYRVLNKEDQIQSIENF